MRLIDSITSGLKETREGVRRRLLSATGGRGREALLEAVEEALFGADLGPHRVAELMDALAGERVERFDDVIRTRLLAMAGQPGVLRLGTPPAVILLVGVNGSGKTTTAAKLAWRFGQEGKTALLGAADTFRAAAGSQLAAWGDRLGIDVVEHQSGGDPAAVAFDTVAAAKARKIDVALIDTAGRLHTQAHLMDELKKIGRTVDKAKGSPADAILLVLDGITGQNAIAQAKAYREALPVSALAVTKLDGSAKGGSVFRAAEELSLPVAFLGVGERPEDLVPFEPQAFVDGFWPADMLTELAPSQG